MEDNPSLFAQASEAAGRGDKLAARTRLDELVFNEPGNEQAWLLLAEVVEDRNEECDCLQQALAINPKNAAAQQKYDDLLHRFPELAELVLVKAAAAKAEADKAEEARKKVVVYSDSHLDLEKLDDSPLFSGDGQPTDWKGSSD
jgi:hypothetical protein